MASYPGERPKTQHQVEDAIEDWHELSRDVREMIGGLADSIPNYLGWTWDEYAQWVYDGTLPEE
jgi:hypothetical protein